ncbi:hypothetical protein B0H16DRAFT_1458765 [Mycena metata]|uniref:Uncharacterized protein n=1 Tax=Mycena metata TaxID=1033252 RepID=A0AAD7NCP7_9AGAR|nr:hypothetical protein B0H16DRAFT_1458765 [Mycena metata]
MSPIHYGLNGYVTDMMALSCKTIVDPAKFSSLTLMSSGATLVDVDQQSGPPLSKAVPFMGILSRCNDGTLPNPLTFGTTSSIDADKTVLPAHLQKGLSKVDAAGLLSVQDSIKPYRLWRLFLGSALGLPSTHRAITRSITLPEGALGNPALPEHQNNIVDDTTLTTSPAPSPHVSMFTHFGLIPYTDPMAKRTTGNLETLTKIVHKNELQMQTSEIGLAKSLSSCASPSSLTHRCIPGSRQVSLGVAPAPIAQVAREIFAETSTKVNQKPIYGNFWSKWSTTLRELCIQYLALFMATGSAKCAYMNYLWFTSVMANGGEGPANGGLHPVTALQQLTATGGFRGVYTWKGGTPPT